MSEVVTKRLLTDETGQLLVTALNSIAASCKPDATEINMGPNNDTKVATQINSLSEQIATYDFGTIASQSALESALVTSISNMTDGQFKHVRVLCNPAFGVFTNSVYYGTIVRYNSSRIHVELYRADNMDEYIIGIYTSSTWKWDELALNSKFTWVLLGIKTALNDNLQFPATANEICISMRHKDGYEYTTVVPCNLITANRYIYLGNSIPSVGAFCFEITMTTGRYIYVTVAKKDSSNIASGDFTLTVYYR